MQANQAHALQILKTALIWISVAVAVVLLWLIRDALLIAFGAILVAMLLRIMAEAFAKWTHTSVNFGLLVTIIFVIALLGVIVWLFGANISGQFAEVLSRAQQAQKDIKAAAGHGALSEFIAQLQKGGSSMMSSALSYMLSIALSSVEGIVVLAITANYLAAQPDLYRRGAIQLFPPHLRPWARDTLDHIWVSLRLWLLAQLILMLLVGVLSLIAVWLIGLPSPVALGLIAGVTEFVPYVGPFIGAIPAVLVALTKGLAPALWTMLAYLMIHVFEGYLVGPLLQQRFISIPPALILLGMVAVELIFGPIGVIVAAPITVAAFLAIKMFYIRDTLHQPTDIPGEDK